MLDFEDPLERRDPDETEREGDELLEPELDLVTLGVLLDLLFPEELERVTDDFLDPELDLVTLEVLLERLPLENNSDNFLFDNQMLAQIIFAGFDIGEITCPTRYEEDSSSISLISSTRYGLGVVATSILFRCHRWGLYKSKLQTKYN